MAVTLSLVDTFYLYRCDIIICSVFFAAKISEQAGEWAFSHNHYAHVQ